MASNVSTVDRNQSFLRVLFTIAIFKATSGFFDVLIEGSLMTKPDKNFLAFSIRIVDFKVQFFFRCKEAMVVKVEAIKVSKFSLLFADG